MKKILAPLMVILFLLSLTACGNKKNEPAMSGSYLENISDFAETDNSGANSAEGLSGVAKAYLQGVTYQIVELDKDNKVATLDVRIPNIAKILPLIVTDVMEKNEGTSYDELLLLVQSELEKALSDKAVECTTTTVYLPLQEVDGKYKLVRNEVWNDRIFGSLQEMYLEYYCTMIGGMTDETPE